MLRSLSVLTIIGYVSNFAFVVGESQIICGKNQVLNRCVNRIIGYRKCSEVGGIVEVSLIDPRNCKKGCKCIDTYLEADDGTCVPENECPTKTPAVVCETSKVYDSCVNSGCDKRHCSQPDGLLCTNPLSEECEEGCKCKKGLLETDDGLCVSADLCALYDNDDGLRTFKDGDISLNLQLLYALAKTSPGLSFAYSPVSALLLLSQLALHTSGKSSEQLLKMTNLKTKHKLWYLIPYCLDVLSAQKDVVYYRGEKIFASEQYKFSDNFKNFTKELCKSEAHTFNEASKTNVAKTTTINFWATQKTEKSVADLVVPNTFNQNTTLILVSASYFNGNWLNSFDPAKTKSEFFYVNSNKQVTVNMMKQSGTYKYADISYLDAQVLSIPYKENNYTLLFMLPHKIDGMSTLLDKLRTYESVSLWRNLLDSLNDTVLDISIPKFETRTSTDLISALNTANVTEIFNTKGASGMSGIFQVPRTAYVSHARQHTTMVVNEFGLTAGSVSTLSSATALLSPILGILDLSKNTEFNANHQFFYTVLCEDTPITSGIFAGQ